MPERVPAQCSVLSSCNRWAAAAADSGSTRPMCARTLPAANQRFRSAAHIRISSGDALNITKKVRVVIEADKTSTVFVDLNQK